MNINRRLLGSTRSHRGLIFLVLGLGWVGGVFTILQAMGLSRVITAAFLEGGNLEDLTPWLIALAGIFLARSAVQWGGEVAAGTVSIRIRMRLREALLGQLLALGPAYAQGEQTGAQAVAALQGVDALDAYFSQYLPQVALAGLVPLTILVVSFPIDWLSGLVFLITAPLIPIFMVLIGQAAVGLTRRQFGALSRMSAFLLDTIQGITTLKLLNQTKAQGERIESVSDQYRQKTMSVLRVAFLSALVLEMVGTLSTAVIAVQIGLRLLGGGLAFEQAFLILILAPEFYLPVRLLGQRFHSAETGRVAAQRIFEVMGIPVGEDGIHAFPECEGGVKVALEDVGYCYPDRIESVLEQVTFSVRPKRVTALVGVSGVGKSTVVQLIMGFIKPARGRIKVNEIEMGTMHIQTWRAQIAWLPQHPHLFHGTIGFNLRLAKAEASLAELRRVCGKARLDDFIQTLPEQYETIIGDGGLVLSGGQVQRLALARAFLTGGSFLVVDEPTAWLDEKLEKDLSAAISELSVDRTVLILAHRRETVMRADWVVVLEDGRVVEEGLPDDLSAKGGAFTRLMALEGELK